MKTIGYKGFYVRALNSQKLYQNIKWEHCKFQTALSLWIWSDF